MTKLDAPSYIEFKLDDGRVLAFHSLDKGVQAGIYKRYADGTIESAAPKDVMLYLATGVLPEFKLTSR